MKQRDETNKQVKFAFSIERFPLKKFDSVDHRNYIGIK